jgi:hypothetical protein
MMTSWKFIRKAVIAMDKKKLIAEAMRLSQVERFAVIGGFCVCRVFTRSQGEI